MTALKEKSLQDFSFENVYPERVEKSPYAICSTPTSLFGLVELESASVIFPAKVFAPFGAVSITPEPERQ